MLTASKHFPSHQICRQLADSLQIDDASNFVESLRESNPRVSVGEVAYRILKQWKREKGAEEATIGQLVRVMQTQLNFRQSVYDSLRNEFEDFNQRVFERQNHDETESEFSQLHSCASRKTPLELSHTKK